MIRITIGDFIIVACLGLIILAFTRCDPASNCPLEVGDRVANVTTEQKGRVISIGSGGWTSDCSVSIRHDDNTFSQSPMMSGDGYYDTSPEYVRNWKYRLIGE